MTTIKRTIEEKAKAYDEARKVAENIHRFSSDLDEIKRMEQLFPELKESEDESIRKSIIGFLITISSLKDGKTVSNEDFDSKAILEWVAWLEKQGEQKPAEKVEPKFKIGDKIHRKTPSSCDKVMQVARIEKDYYICNHICKFSSEVVPFSKQSSYELIEHNPAWSEDDEYYYGIIQYILNNECVGETDKENANNWLKSLKDRVQPQPKQEWSEGDGRVLSLLLNTYKQAVEHRPSSLTHAEVLDIYNWLKSLKERYTWKPSDEQIDALEDAIADAVSSIQKNMLNSLYSDLKKLKGE